MSVSLHFDFVSKYRNHSGSTMICTTVPVNSTGGRMAGRWHAESSECRLCAAPCQARNKGSALLNL